MTDYIEIGVYVVHALASRDTQIGTSKAVVHFGVETEVKP